MRDDELGSLIYDVLERKVLKLSEKDVGKEFKNEHLEDDQVHRCLMLLLDRGLVSVHKERGVNLWSLPSEAGVQPSLEKKVSASGDHDARSEQGGQASCVYKRSSGQASCVDRPSAARSSNHSLRESSAEMTKSRKRLQESAHSSTHTNTQRNGEISVCPQSSDIAGALTVAEQENTPTTLSKTFGDMTISTSADTTVAEYTSLKPEVQQCCDNFQKILHVLKYAESPLKGAEVAKKVGIGQSKKSVNSLLYFLERKRILKKSADGTPSWSLVDKHELTGENVKEIAIDYYMIKKPGAEASLAVSPGSADSRTTDTGGRCKTCNGPCNNIENHYHLSQTHIHNHNHIYQVGDNNTVYVPRADGNSSVENG